jgi:DNA primase
MKARERYTPDTLEGILRRTDVVALVGKRVKLIVRGSTAEGLCCFHKEKTPSFKVDNRRRTYHCFGCGAHGDAFDWLMQTEGLSFPEAVQKLAGSEVVATTTRWQDTAPAAKSAPEPEPNPEALRIWLAVRQIDDGLGSRYFRERRRILSTLPSSVRFGFVWHQLSGREWPAVVAAIARPTDRKIIAVQVTYLDENGNKAPFENPRLTFGTLGTAAIRLAEADQVLGIAEGTETALSAMELSGIPCWSSVGAPRLPKVTVPNSVRVIHVFGDNDEPGRLAAERTAARHTREGRKVYLRFPPAGFNDYNDVLMARSARVAA